MSDEVTQTTHDITVAVRTVFLDDQSDPGASRFVWAYRVRIANTGSAIVQLRARTWQIIDAEGRAQEIRGDGVIGEQPVIIPGGRFEYTSGTPLTTASGVMRGTYHMIDTTTGTEFDVAIPTFSLDSPHARRTVH